jgi:hypothetical protein
MLPFVSLWPLNLEPITQPYGSSRRRNAQIRLVGADLIGRRIDDLFIKHQHRLKWPQIMAGKGGVDLGLKDGFFCLLA